MHFYQSGTPRCDKFQETENRFCTHRLFSLHGSYERAVLNWLNMIVDKPEQQYPRYILLDSGAFTAWNAGHETNVEDVIQSYERFIAVAEPYFDEIWAINLDKIPGEAGRDPTPEEITEAIAISDVNFKILTEKFGNRILPVYHQGEPLERGLELQEMTDKTSKYICVSPRNDLPEGRRREWAQQVHAALRKDTRTHGLATTGNLMLERVPWYSADSATWILVAAYGGIIYYWDTGTVPRYMTMAISNEGGRDRFQGNHFDSLQEVYKEAILQSMKECGFTVEQIKTDVRPRSLFNMWNLERYAAHIRKSKKPFPVQSTLFGI